MFHHHIWRIVAQELLVGDQAAETEAYSEPVPKRNGEKRSQDGGGSGRKDRAAQSEEDVEIYSIDNGWSKDAFRYAFDAVPVWCHKFSCSPKPCGGSQDRPSLPNPSLIECNKRRDASFVASTDVLFLHALISRKRIS